jgi:UDP-N-acetylmuramate: L-alanyl-gamma-D-glutamyl-meso-diaminopimelate ligase
MTAQKPVLQELNSLKRVHIIGVGGTLMGAFAAFLKRRGIQVTGSDLNVYPPMSDVLKEAGVVVLSGYKPENLTATGGSPELVVIGNVIRADNPEARAAIDGGYAYSSLPEAMEKLLLKESRNLVVAGTHGKTTTSSILAHVLRSCGQDPNFFIGGVSQDLPFSFHVAGTNPGRLFVLEGDEYDTAFWDKVPKFNHYLPDDVILTSVEYDHADIYPDLNAVVKAFEGIVTRVRPGGRIIGCYDYPIVKDLLSRAHVEVISYGSSLASQARFIPGRVWLEDEFARFEIMDQGKVVDEIALQIPGMHNVLNAMTVWIECQALKIPSSHVREALRKFRGVKRRQEVRGEVKGVMVMDDFAHHPTAVRETLRALRSKYPKRRLVSVFEPRSATSRRKVFQKDYVSAFQESDVTYIATPFDQTRIASEDQFSSNMLIDDLAQLGKEAYLIESVETGVQEVAKASQEGDLIAVLSNGGFGGFIQKLLDELKKS